MKKEITVTAGVLWIKYFRAVQSEMPGANHGMRRHFQYSYSTGKNRGEIVNQEPGGKSHLIVRIRLGDLEYNVWTEDTFKEVLQMKHLTSHLRQEIISAKPEQVEVTKKMERNSTFRYVLSTESARNWVRTVRRLDVTE